MNLTEHWRWQNRINEKGSRKAPFIHPAFTGPFSCPRHRDTCCGKYIKSTLKGREVSGTPETQAGGPCELRREVHWHDPRLARPCRWAISPSPCSLGSAHRGLVCRSVRCGVTRLPLQDQACRRPREVSDWVGKSDFWGAVLRSQLLKATPSSPKV